MFCLAYTDCLRTNNNLRSLFTASNSRFVLYDEKLHNEIKFPSATNEEFYVL